MRSSAESSLRPKTLPVAPSKSAGCGKPQGSQCYGFSGVKTGNMSGPLFFFFWCDGVDGSVGSGPSDFVWAVALLQPPSCP